jgi:hypothetical protein
VVRRRLCRIRVGVTRGLQRATGGSFLFDQSSDTRQFIIALILRVPISRLKRIRNYCFISIRIKVIYTYGFTYSVVFSTVRRWFLELWWALTLLTRLVLLGLPYNLAILVHLDKFGCVETLNLPSQVRFPGTFPAASFGFQDGVLFLLEFGPVWTKRQRATFKPLVAEHLVSEGGGF